MLPYSPLHHLLLADAGVPLVMTSGNVSDEPIAFRDADALERLARDRRPLLGHDRPIQTRTDDSVARPSRSGPAAPLLAAPLARLRARGGRAARGRRSPAARLRAELKNTFCLARDDRAWVGHHIGDLRTSRRWARSRTASSLRAPVRGRAGGGRPRPPPGVPVDGVRPRARGGWARWASSTITRTWPRAWPSTASGGRRWARSSTARATAPTARSGAASSCSAISPASSGRAPLAGTHARRRGGDP